MQYEVRIAITIDSGSRQAVLQYVGRLAKRVQPVLDRLARRMTADVADATFCVTCTEYGVRDIDNDCSVPIGRV